MWTSESLYMPMIFLSFINFWSSEVYMGRMWYSLGRPWEMSKMHKICINALYDNWGHNCNEDGEGELKLAQTKPPVSGLSLGSKPRRQAQTWPLLHVPGPCGALTWTSSLPQGSAPGPVCPGFFLWKFVPRTNANLQLSYYFSKTTQSKTCLQFRCWYLYFYWFQQPLLNFY